MSTLTNTEIEADENAREAREAIRRADILHRFDSFNITPEQSSALHASRHYFRDQVATFILNTTKPGREQSAALTALEEAKFWTNQAIAKDGTPE